MPTDFYFKITDDVNTYDSRNGHYTRRAINSNFKDTVVIAKLTHDDLKNIYQTMMRNYALNLPDNFECVPNSEYIIPSFTTTLQFQIGKEYRKVMYNDGCQNPKDRWSVKNFAVIDSTIGAVLSAKPSIKKLPETKLFFL